MMSALFLSFRQLGDPAFRTPLLKAAGLAALGFAGLVALCAWGADWLAGGEGWIAAVASALGGLLALFGAVWLFLPAVIAIAGLFLDGVAGAVERVHYPQLPPARGAPLHAQVMASLRLALRVLGLMVVALPIALLMPPLGAVVLFVVGAFSLGYGLFDGVAQRRMGVVPALALRRRLRLPILGLGAVLAAASAVPLLNLMVPVLGTAAMTHLFHRKSGS
jgi:CysZ protein